MAKKRLEIMQRDNFTCQHCGSSDRELQVHHFVYHKNCKPWEYNDGELITLCQKCHTIESELNEVLYHKYKTVKQAFKENGFSYELFDTLMFDMFLFLVGEDCSIEVKEFFRNSILQTKKYNDAISAYKHGIECRDIVKSNFPNLLDDFDTKVGYEE